MKIGIVGVGMVGSAISFGFRRIGHEVLPHDFRMDTKLSDVLPSQLCFICIPTPKMDDGSCDVQEVRNVVQHLVMLNYNGLIVIKSTVTPGTTDALAKRFPKARIAFCPEFLRERAAFSDFVEDNDVCICGVYRDMHFETLKAAHGSLPKSFARLSPLEAEFCKYFSNTFNALRIVFANQFYDVCKAAGADYTAIKNAIVKRSNIGDHYLECNEQFRAFGGSCLPKDTAAFAAFARSLKLTNVEIFDRIIAINDSLTQPTKSEVAQ